MNETDIYSKQQMGGLIGKGKKNGTNSSRLCERLH